MQIKYSDRAPAKIDVMTSFEGENIDAIQVLLLSLSETHPRDEIAFWLFEQSLSDSQIDAVKAYCQSLGNVSLRTVKVPHASDFDVLKKLGGRPDSARFFWLVAHECLPKDLKRIIYLDALDIIVNDDLVPFLRHPFLGSHIIACREFSDIPPVFIGSARKAHDLWAPIALVKHVAKGLANSGSIVINLDKFRNGGMDIGYYIDAAEWARNKLGVNFGDQGLFSLTHGSSYVQAHDRYNYRFSNDLKNFSIKNPAVIHYAGRVLKPVNWHLPPEQESIILDYIKNTGKSQLVLDRWHAVDPRHLHYQKMWWDICARTPCYERIKPLATQRMTNALGRVGLKA